MKKNARITIDCKNIISSHVSSYMFGNFVEDIRDHMDAMLAFMLKNMDFEEEDINVRGVSGCWYPITNSKNTTFGLEPAAPKHSGHSQRIKVLSAERGIAGIGQKIAVTDNTTYKIKMFMRASLEIREVKIEIADACNGEILGSTEINIISHDWREYLTEIRVSRTCTNAEFRVMISAEGAPWKDGRSTGMVWFDHISMLPSDHVGLVKKEVFDMARNLNCGMMRLGGNHISTYHWKHYVGPHYYRPSAVNEAWGGWTSKYFATDEFIDFCKGLKVEPLICINAGSGTPEEAVEWMEYCNGSITSPMGALRAVNGHPEPYNVKYWQVGNEIFGAWQVGHCSAEEYAKRYLEFHKAMKAADPGITLLACGDTKPAWNRTLIDVAGESLEYIAIHIYHSYGRIGIPENMPEEEKYKGVVAYPEVTRSILKNTIDMIKENSKYNHIKLAITEYNTMYYPAAVREGMPNEHTLEAAVANAANLNEFLRNSEYVEITNFSDLVNGWLGGCIRVGDNYADQVKGKIPGWTGKGPIVYGSPTYYVLEAYANRDFDRVLSCSVESNTFSVKTERPILENLPVLDVVSCINKTGDTLTLFVVNRSLEAISVEMDTGDFQTTGTGMVWEISGESIKDINDVFNPDRITSRSYEIKPEKGSYLNLKAHSVYVFTFDGSLVE